MQFPGLIAEYGEGGDAGFVSAPCACNSAGIDGAFKGPRVSAARIVTEKSYEVRSEL